MAADRTSSGRSIFTYSSAMLLSHFVRLIQGLIVVKLMEPAVMGLWLGIQLISAYGMHSHFGMLNALNRQIPSWAAKEEHKRVEQIEAVGRAVMLLVGVLWVVVTIAVCALGGFDRKMTAGVLATGLVVAITLNSEFYSSLFRSHHRFGTLGVVKLIESFFMLGGLPLVYLWGFYGICVRAVAVAALCFVASMLLYARPVGIKLEWRETVDLFKVGIPIAVLGYAIVLSATLDKVLILTFLGREQLGFYALCVVAGSFVGLLPQTIGQVFYPRMIELYAKSGISRSHIIICAKASLLAATLAGIVCTAMFFVIPWVVVEYLDTYAPGIPATRVALLGFFLAAFAAGPQYFFIAVSQKRRQLGILLIAAGLLFSCGYFLSRYGLVGIAWSMVIASAFRSIGYWTLVLFAGERLVPEPTLPRLALLHRRR